MTLNEQNQVAHQRDVVIALVQFRAQQHEDNLVLDDLVRLHEISLEVIQAQLLTLLQVVPVVELNRNVNCLTRLHELDSKFVCAIYDFLATLWLKTFNRMRINRTKNLLTTI